MKTIYKYTLELKDLQELKIPKQSEFLSCQIQNGDINLWFLVDNTKELEDRFFEIIGTGNEVVCDMGIERKYLVTLQYNYFVWHIFERLN